jgi:hypothetical protein
LKNRTRIFVKKLAAFLFLNIERFITEFWRINNVYTDIANFLNILTMII